MRLFVAVNLGEAMIEALSEIQNALKDYGVEGNFTRLENLHLILAFMEDYGKPDVILDAMSEVPFRPLKIRLEGFKHYRDMCFALISDCPELRIESKITVQ